MSNQDFASISDDDFEKFLESGETPSVQEPLDEASDTSEEQELDNSSDDELELAPEAQEQAQEEETDLADGEDETLPTEAENASEAVDEEETGKAEKATEVPEEYKALFEPFKAAGRDFQAKSVDEIKRLMQMGVDYSEKLQGFKAHRKTIKTLEQHSIDSDRLNLLIDASKGNPQAIAKLLQDHKLNPMDLETQEGTDYVPSDFSVSDSQVELDDVLERIQSSPSFSRTSDIITNQWDSASKAVVFKDPSMIERLNEHVANGTYERVMQEVTRAKVFGGLAGLSTLEAYQQVGMQLQRDGAFNKPAERVTTAPAADKAKEVNGQKRKVAIASKATPAKPVKPKVDYVSMSDDQFEKLLNDASISR